MSKPLLDASALLALLNQEPGAEQVERAVAGGAAIGAVNLSEVVAKLGDAGMPEAAIRGALEPLGLEVVGFDAALAYRTGMLRPKTKRLGLSLGDRACLALAEQLNTPVLTADQAWQGLALGIAIEVVR